MTTTGTWYSPSSGTGSFLALANPPFAMTTTFTETIPPPPDQFKGGLGKVAVVQDLEHPTVPGQAFCVVRLRPNAPLTPAALVGEKPGELPRTRPWWKSNPALHQHDFSL